MSDHPHVVLPPWMWWTIIGMNTFGGIWYLDQRMYWMVAASIAGIAIGSFYLWLDKDR